MMMRRAEQRGDIVGITAFIFGAIVIVASLVSLFVSLLAIVGVHF